MPGLRRRQRGKLKQLLLGVGRKDLFGVEVGTYKGELASWILRRCPVTRLWVVDLWDSEVAAKTMLLKENMTTVEREARRRLKPFGERVVIVKADSAEAANYFLDDQLDFVYIDACHLYEHVKRDVVAWWPKVRKGGVLCGHDYGGMGDVCWGWGVRRAVEEFACERLLEVETDIESRTWWIWNTQQS